MKRFLSLAFSVLVLMMSWEGQLTSANVLDNGPIPQESIRLRIIANSDSFQDQWLKREVRDALIAQMNVWAKEVGSYEEARQVVAANLPKLQKVVDNTLRERGFSYQTVVDFGQVPFPTKLYGSYVYPAGEYEALRVQIGEAKGQNWWCVLFPPLCFIDMSNGDAVQAAEARVDEPQPSEAGTGSEQSTEMVDEEADFADRTREDWQEWRQSRLESREAEIFSESSVSEMEPVAAADQPATAVESEPAIEDPPQAQEVEVRFYLWEKLEKLFS